MIKIALIYVGGGSLRGIPARNLTKEEANRFGGEDYLISTKLYKKKLNDKSYIGGQENKTIDEKEEVEDERD